MMIFVIFFLSGWLGLLFKENSMKYDLIKNKIVSANHFICYQFFQLKTSFNHCIAVYNFNSLFTMKTDYQSEQEEK